MKKQLAFMKYEGYRQSYLRSGWLDRACLAIERPRFYDYHKKGLILHPQQIAKLNELKSFCERNVRNILHDAAPEAKGRPEIAALASRMIETLENGEQTVKIYSETEIYSLALNAINGRSECKFFEGGLDYKEHVMGRFAFELFGALHTLANTNRHSAKAGIYDDGKGWLTFALYCKEKVVTDFLSGHLLTQMAEIIGARLEINEIFGSTSMLLHIPAEGKYKRPKPSPPVW